jgi:hypothetical protein
MNTSVVPKFIVNLFKSEIQRIHKLLLYDIAQDYNIPYEELEKRYVSDVDINNDKIQIVKRRDYNANLKDEKRCIAYNAKHKQCQRSKGGIHEHFCPIHAKNHKYGTILEKQMNVKDKKWSKLY